MPPSSSPSTPLELQAIPDLAAWFPDLDEPRLMQRLRDHGQWRDFRAGDELIRPGEIIPFLPLITEGTVRILRADTEDGEGREIFLYFLQPGETCALSLDCCRGDARSRVRAVAEEDGRLLAVPARLLPGLLEEFSRFGDFAVTTYRRRFDQLLEAFDAVAFHKLDERLWQYLQDLSIARNTNALRITHEEIARHLGTTREVVSRLVKQLERLGKVKPGRNLVEIVS
jgi:CRP/FNR family transcriptional regulator, anaerobic regulatory protein